MEMYHRRLENIYSDRASGVLRSLLAEPERPWVVRDFIPHGVSPALASMALQKAESMGWVERRKRGWDSHTRLTHKDALLKDWTAFYRFDKNRYVWYVDKNQTPFLPRLRDLLVKMAVPYALTLFSASRQISPYVVDPRDFVYVGGAGDAKVVFEDIASRLGLVRAAYGGNVCLLSPFYKHSAFQQLHEVNGYPLVSDLQLYLDLMGFPPTGPQEVEENLKPLWRKAGVAFV
jgi:hypothetical protein